MLWAYQVTALGHQSKEITHRVEINGSGGWGPAKGCIFSQPPGPSLTETESWWIPWPGRSCQAGQKGLQEAAPMPYSGGLGGSPSSPSGGACNLEAVATRGKMCLGLSSGPASFSFTQSPPSPCTTIYWDQSRWRWWWACKGWRGWAWPKAQHPLHLLSLSPSPCCPRFERMGW